MLTSKRIGLVGSREFSNYAQFKREVDKIIQADDSITSGGAKSNTPGMSWDSKAKASADGFAQRYAKENGFNILIIYPKYAQFGKPATFIRNKIIVENSDVILAFYQKGRFQEGGTANTAKWARDLGVELHEFEEE
jgi:predicted Rossmann fold nucleotide-binding protein DprA/Smf involved in DNA uptake